MRALFVPGNAAHVRTMLPVADVLVARGQQAIFLVRDGVVAADYRVAPLLEASGHPVHFFEGFYETDLGRRFPRPRAFGRSGRDVYAYLGGLEFDLAVLANDDSALFDRLVLEFCRRRRCETLLIQESVRPAHRRLGWRTRLRHEGLSAVGGSLAQTVGRALIPGPFTRKGYAHGGCTMIAAAGDRFRRRLMEEGVPAKRIRVTGQPRLDTAPSAAASVRGTAPASRLERSAPASRRERPAPDKDAVLLFCSQPIPAPPARVDWMFTELVAACGTFPGVKLLFKLHPRDLPEDHWLALLDDASRDRVEVARTRPLDECFAEADAMMTVASTTALEAMSVGLPVGLIDYLPTPWYLPYGEAGAALSVRTPGQLPDAVARLLRDPELRGTLTAHADEVLQDELYLRDGKSAERIADFIQERLPS